MVLGLVAAAVVGLGAYFLVTTGEMYAEITVAQLAFGKDDLPPRLSEVLDFLSGYALLGLPISILFCLVVGIPVWKHAESQPLRSRRHAMLLGALAGGIIGILFLMLGLILALGNSGYNEWHWGYQVTRDGWPTLLGWFLQLLNVVYFAIAGVFGGLAARAVAVPKRLF
jgi:hypothetical protein